MIIFFIPERGEVILQTFLFQAHNRSKPYTNNTEQSDVVWEAHVCRFRIYCTAPDECVEWMQSAVAYIRFEYEVLVVAYNNP